MLQGSEPILFDDAWAKVMQHSAVTDNDLREWMNEWKSAGSLTFVNLDPGQKLPRKHAKQYLKWT
jgi:hypothetical protein